MSNLTPQAIDHIRGSSMDPEILAEQYKISRREVNEIQMGRQANSGMAAHIKKHWPKHPKAMKKLQ